MSTPIVLLLVVGTAVLVGVGVYVLAQVNFRRHQRLDLDQAEVEARRRIAESESSAKERLLEAKEEAVRIRAASEQEGREIRAQSQQFERRLHQKEENLERRVEDVERREQGIGERERSLDEARVELEEATKQQFRELERVANMTRQEAQGVLMSQLEQDLRNEIARRVREAELAARDDSEKRARAIVTEAIQRIAADQTAETSVSVLPLPNEEIKGRINGRAGGNIRALQQATGIDLIIDDTPEAVVISGLDPVRRELARVALNKLMVDGRIHPARSEGIVAKSRQERLEWVKQAGAAAALALGL